MPEVMTKVAHATFVLERKLFKPVGAVFAMLSDPEKIPNWMIEPATSELVEFSCDFQEGGSQVLRYKMGPASPIPGAVISNEVRFQKIVPAEKIVTASTMKMGDHIFSASQMTFELLPVSDSTELIVTHQGAFFEGSDGPVMREQGWNTLLDRFVAVLAR